MFAKRGDHVGVWADPANVALVKKLWGEGLSSTLISEKFHAMGIPITRNSVIGKVHRLGLLRKCGVKHQVRPRVKDVVKPNYKRVFREKNPKQKGAEMVTTPDPTKRVLLRQIRDGQCKAIIGYLNGTLADAVCCGEDAPVIIKRGRVAHGSWCTHHHDIYHIRDRHGSSR